MRIRTRSRWLNAALLVALLLGPGFPAGLALAQIPEPPPSLIDQDAPLEGALRLAPLDAALLEAAPPDAARPDALPPEATTAAPAPQQLTACSAPATIPFGRDLEVTLGPLNTSNNYAAQSLTLSPAWGATYQSTWITGTQTAVDCVGTSPGREQVFFYEDANYEGKCKMLAVGRYPSSSNIGIGNDKLSSVRVGANVDLLLCRDADYSGICETLTGSDTNLGIGNIIGNDKVTSAKVTLAPHAYSVAAVPLGTDKMQVIIKTGSSGTGSVAAQMWQSASSWGDLVYLNLFTDGAPAAVSRTPENYTIVAQSDNTLKYMHGDADGLGMVWQNVPGGYDDQGEPLLITDAVGSPALVSTGPYQLTLFYRTSEGEIKYSEWQSGYGWRQSPVSLGRPGNTAITVDPVAVTRDENHIAVFVVVDSKLYVREWSSANASDWSDTTWVALTSTGSFAAKAIPPAVASRHRTQIGVGILSATNEVWYLEWTASDTVSGWSAPVRLNGTLASLSLTATNVDEMVLHGVTSTGDLYTKRWTQSSLWENWVLQESGWSSSTPLAGLSLRARELAVFGRDSRSRLQIRQYTALGQRPTAATLANTLYGTSRSQAVAMFDARTYWVSAYRSTDGKWYLTAKDTTTWAGPAIQLTNHPNGDTATNKLSVAVGDMDGDGDDEIAVVTLKADSSVGQLSVFELAVGSTGTVTGITSRATTSFALSGSTFKDINVAVGNLANTTTLEGVSDEIVVSAIRDGYSQVRLAAYRFTGSSLSSLASQTMDVIGSLRDLELTIAQIDGTGTEKIVFAAQSSLISALYQYRLSGTSFVPYPDENNVQMLPMMSLGAGTSTSAIASGDVDADGLEEVVYVAGARLSVYPNGGHALIPTADSYSLAVGDMNMDGLAEIVYSSPTYTVIFRDSHLGDSQMLIRLGDLRAGGVPLLADLDGDSLVANYTGNCSEFKEVEVISVLNSQPQWYSPEHTTYHYNEGGLSNSNTEAEGDEYAWQTSLGGSLTVGFEQELSFIVKLGKVSSSVSYEVKGSVGRGNTRETSQATLSGGSFLGASATGIVCYVQAGYACYSYDVTDPSSGATSTAMVCPTRSLGGQATQVCEPLNDWYTLTRSAAGDSWAPVGHRMRTSDNVIMHTLDMSIEGNYAIPNNNGRTLPPVDPYLVWWDGWDVRKDVGPTSVVSDSGEDWGIQRETAVGTTEHYGFEANITQSSGVGVAGFTVERSLTAGFGNEWNSSTTWSTGLEFSGSVYDYDYQACGNLCTPYTVAPFVYRAQAVTNAGARYTYLEQDYYLTYDARYQTSDVASESIVMSPAPVVASVPPQAPIVTSPTHPDPDTWYAGDTVVFDWSQPVDDQADVTGYKWDLNQFAVFTPTATTKMTTTQTYLNLADGAYYLHILAKGNGANRSPVIDRQVLVDNQAPQVEFVADPNLPNGFDGWYTVPVAISVVATDTVGSGVAGIETSTDGTDWLPYGAPIPVTADTPGFTLWARATDNVGHTSEPVSTTIKLDTALPSTYDSEGYGLSYASIITDEVGNAQLVLGGALTDTLSGRLQVEVTAGQTGLWHAVDAVGDLPMPPGNQFSTTISSLQWIYTPTFSVRGVYPLWARGVDAAGNYESAWIHGVFWWEPDDVPVLAESQVSVSPHEVYPGDVVAFTVGARNSGYQEAQMLITNTVPAGLTVLPDSISDQGQYDAASRVITWTLDALWPGQMRYLFFNATADQTTTPITLENRLDMMAYWPWEPLPGVPPEPARHYATTSTELKVLPAMARASADTSDVTAPRVLNVSVIEGDIVSAPQVTLLVNATSNAYSLYVKEWAWDSALNQWTLAGESGWVPFQAASDLEISQDAGGKYGRYMWTLSDGDGVRYIGVWVSDGNGQVSNLNEGNMIYTNLVSVNGQQLTAGQRIQYRVDLHANDLTLLNLVSLSGDADLYIWKPRAGFMPHYYSNAVPTDTSLALDTVGFLAPEEGMYVIEVQAVTDTYYRLVTAGALSGSGLLAETQVNPAWAILTENDLALLQTQDALMYDASQNLTSLQSIHLALDEKDRPAHPLTLSTPYSLPNAAELSESPSQPSYYVICLPLVLKGSATLGR